MGRPVPRIIENSFLTHLSTEKAAHLLFAILLNLVNCKSKHQNKGHTHPKGHLFLSSNGMLFKAKHLVYSTIHSFDRSSAIVESLPFVTASGYGCENTRIIG